MSTSIHPIIQNLHGRDVAVFYRDLITRCARAHSVCYDDQQELISSVVLGLLQYPKPIEYPEQFVRVMTRNLAINRTRTGSGYWEVVESQMADNPRNKPDATSMLSRHAGDEGQFNQVILKDTLVRLEHMLTPAETRCYKLLKAGFDQSDVAIKLGVSRQAVSKIVKEIRKKFLQADNG